MTERCTFAVALLGLLLAVCLQPAHGQCQKPCVNGCATIDLQFSGQTWSRDYSCAFGQKVEFTKLQVFSQVNLFTVTLQTTTNNGSALVQSIPTGASPYCHDWSGYGTQFATLTLICAYQQQGYCKAKVRVEHRCVNDAATPVPPTNNTRSGVDRWLGSWTADQTCDRATCCCIANFTLSQGASSNSLAFKSALQGNCSGATQITSNWDKWEFSAADDQWYGQLVQQALPNANYTVVTNGDEIGIWNADYDWTSDVCYSWGAVHGSFSRVTEPKEPESSAAPLNAVASWSIVGVASAVVLVASML